MHIEGPGESLLFTRDSHRTPVSTYIDARCSRIKRGVSRVSWRGCGVWIVGRVPPQITWVECNNMVDCLREQELYSLLLANHSCFLRRKSWGTRKGGWLMDLLRYSEQMEWVVVLMQLLGQDIHTEFRWKRSRLRLHCDTLFLENFHT